VDYLVVIFQIVLNAKQIIHIIKVNVQNAQYNIVMYVLLLVYLDKYVDLVQQVQLNKY
jgi:hypothetical protein